MKLANGNTGHAQVILIILCLFINCYIIYSARPAYYLPGHHSNTISLGDLKFYVGFQKFTSETIGKFDFIDSLGRYWRSPYQTQHNLDYLHIEMVKVNAQRDSNIVVPTVCDLLKQNLYQIIHQNFGHVSISRII